MFMYVYVILGSLVFIILLKLKLFIFINGLWIFNEISGNRVFL